MRVIHSLYPGNWDSYVDTFPGLKKIFFFTWFRAVMPPKAWHVYFANHLIYFFVSQIRLRGASPKLNFLPGAAGPPAGLLPLPRGAAGRLRARAAVQHLEAALLIGHRLEQGGGLGGRAAATSGEYHQDLINALYSAVGLILLRRNVDWWVVILWVLWSLERRETLMHFFNEFCLFFDDHGR